MKTKRFLAVIIFLFSAMVISVPGISADDDESGRCSELSQVMNELTSIKKQINVQGGITKEDVELIRSAMGKVSGIFNRARTGSKTPMKIKHSSNDGLKIIEKMNEFIKKKNRAGVLEGIDKLYKIMAMFRDYSDCDE